MELTKFDRRLAQKRRDPGFLYAELVGNISDELNHALSVQHITRSSLARKLGVSKAYVSRLLNEHPNLTIRSYVQIANALNRKVLTHLVPFEQQESYLVPVLEDSDGSWTVDGEDNRQRAKSKFRSRIVHQVAT